MPPNNTTAENQLVSPSSSVEACRASLGNLGLASGSHPAHKARVSLNLLPGPLLPSYSAVTQNVELFIQPDGKRVGKKKVGQSPGEHRRERWDTWTPVSAPQSYWEGNITYSGIPDLGVLYPCVKIFLKIQTEEYWRFASFQVLEGAKPRLPASSANA